MMRSSDDLPAPVRSQDADLGAREEGQRDVLQHLTVGGMESADLVHGVDVLSGHGPEATVPTEAVAPDGGPGREAGAGSSTGPRLSGWLHHRSGTDPPGSGRLPAAGPLGRLLGSSGRRLPGRRLHWQTSWPVPSWRSPSALVSTSSPLPVTSWPVLSWWTSWLRSFWPVPSWWTSWLRSFWPVPSWRTSWLPGLLGGLLGRCLLGRCLLGGLLGCGLFGRCLLGGLLGRCLLGRCLLGRCFLGGLLGCGLLGWCFLGRGLLGGLLGASSWRLLYRFLGGFGSHVGFAPCGIRPLGLIRRRRRLIVERAGFAFPCRDVWRKDLMSRRLGSTRR